MKAYNYHAETKEYLNEVDVDQDPIGSAIHALIIVEKTDSEIASTLGVLEAAVQEIRENGVPDLLPANSTTIVPPKSVERKARLFRNGTWDYIDDYRGVLVEANDGSKRTQTITTLGVKPVDVRFEPMAPTDEAKVHLRTHLASMIDYLVNPTEEKKTALVALYQELIDNAA